MSGGELPADPWPADGDEAVGVAWAAVLWRALLEAPDEYVLQALDGLTHDDLRWMLAVRLLFDRSADRGAS